VRESVGTWGAVGGLSGAVAVMGTGVEVWRWSEGWRVGNRAMAGDAHLFQAGERS
jgi:hypothetical protein